MPTAVTQHGPIDYVDEQVFRVEGGLVGFPEARRFILLESPDIEPLRWLVCVDQPEPSLLVVDPRLLVSDYRVTLEEGDRKLLQVDEGSEVLPLAIAVVGENPEASTCNLMAPIVINSTRMVAVQLVLADSEYAVQHPLLAPSTD